MKKLVLLICFIPSLAFADPPFPPGTRSYKNIFGGKTYTLPNGQRYIEAPNNMGGYNYYSRGGNFYSRKNGLGGQTYGGYSGRRTYGR